MLLVRALTKDLVELSLAKNDNLKILLKFSVVSYLCLLKCKISKM